MKDLYHSVRRVLAIGPANHTASISSAAIDCLGYNSVLVIVDIGVLNAAAAGNNIVFTLTEGPTNAAAGIVPATDYIVEADDWDLTINDLAEASNAKGFGWKRSTSGSRWIKVVATETGAFDGFFGVTVLLYNAEQEPVY